MVTRAGAVTPAPFMPRQTALTADEFMGGLHMTQPTTAVSLTPVRRSRWFVLAAFGLLVACTQVLWLSFAPITTQAHEALGVSEGAIGDLAVINPLMFVLLAIPVGR